MTGFTVLGVFVASLIFVAVFVMIVGAVCWDDPILGFNGGCVIGLIIVMVLLLAYLSYTGVTFKQNPEMYGYTKIIEEGTE